MPLDSLLGALRALLRRRGPQDTAELLSDEGALLGPLLGMPASVRPLQVLADSMLGPAVLYGALTAVLGRLARRAPLAIVIDDGHLGGRALRDFLEFLRRQELPVMVVVAIRPGTGEWLPATSVIHLDVLGRAAAAELVGPDRGDALYGRSRGNPLFLTELAQQAADIALPASLVESVSARCEELGSAGALLRAAAVIGPELDLDLISAVLGRSVIELLDATDAAVSQQFLVDEDGLLRFRHELVREALAASATAGRSALLHRQALLDDALSLDQDAAGLLARARVRIRRGRYADALADVERSGQHGAEALEVSAWAAYFGRHFGQAVQFAEEGAIAAVDTATRARCLAVAGRIHHAAGDLAAAEAQLTDALASPAGPDRVTAAARRG